MGTGHIAPLDPTAARSWQLLADRIATETDPRLRANLEVVARHVAEEVRGDLDALLDTLVPRPVYRIWGASQPRRLGGRAEVRRFYEDLVETGRNRLEFEVTRVVVDADTVVTEGIFRHAYLGGLLVERGVSSLEDVDASAWYLVEYQATVLWPIAENGLIAGESIYAGEPPRIVRRLEEGEAGHLGPPAR